MAAARHLAGAAGTQAPSALWTAGISHSGVGRLRDQRGTAASFVAACSAKQRTGGANVEATLTHETSGWPSCSSST